MELNGTNNTNNLKPWQRQPGESPAAYRAFCLYRDLGPERSLRKAWALAAPANSSAQGETTPNKQATTPQPPGNRRPVIAGHWTAWSSQHSWYKRALAYDEQVQCPEYQLDLRRIERRRRAQIAYEEVLDKLIDNLATELPYLLFATRTTTNAIGERTVTRGISPTAIATLLREIRQFEYVVQHGFDAKPPRPPAPAYDPDAMADEPLPEQPIQPKPSRGSQEADAPQPTLPTIDIESLSASLLERLREQLVQPAIMEETAHEWPTSERPRC